MDQNVLTDAPPSARELRDRYQSDQSNSARLRVLYDAGRVLAGAGDDDRLAAVLGLALAFSAFEAGALLLREADALRIKASRGPVLPAGARFTADGALAAMLKPDASNVSGHLVRRNVVSRLPLPAGGVVGMEILLPLTGHGETAGVLALVSRKALAEPGPSDLQTLETLCTMLAMAAHEGAAPHPAQSARRIEQVLAPLTAREREVLALLPQGLTNADIGQKLGIATGTVKVHMERIIHKLALGDRTQAAALAVELGFVGSGIKP